MAQFCIYNVCSLWLEHAWIRVLYKLCQVVSFVVWVLARESGFLNSHYRDGVCIQYSFGYTVHWTLGNYLLYEMLYSGSDGRVLVFSTESHIAAMPIVVYTCRSWFVGGGGISELICQA